MTTSKSSNASTSSSSSPYAALTAGSQFWVFYSYSGSSPEAVMHAYVQDGDKACDGQCGYSLESCTVSGGQATCVVDQLDSNGDPVSTSTLSVNLSGTWSGGGCGSGMTDANGCMTYVPPPLPPPFTGSPSSAAADTPASDLSDELNPTFLADVTDALWQDAAQTPGYSGLPYPVSAPVTSAQASGVEDGLGTSAPTVGSVVGGAGTLSGVSSSTPFSTTGADVGSGASGVTVATDPGSGAQVNLGPDPRVGAPGLESTPTATQILQPLLNMLPDLRSFSVPAHGATCPEPSFTVFGQTYTVSEHCTLFEQYRSAIYGASVLAFSIAALFIVLTA